MVFTNVRLRTALATACLLSLTACADMLPPYALKPDDGAVVGALRSKADFIDGYAVYAIDLEIPPGRDDIQPALSLRYSSRTGDTEFGMGWFMNYTTEIDRCPATLATDGYTDGVRFTTDDRLCMNGEHLILVAGKYGMSGSRYRGLMDNHDEVQLFGDSDKPDSWFVVHYHNGSHVVLKQVNVLPGGKSPLTWYETLFEDSRGDTIERHYDTSVPGEMPLSDIYYTGHDTNGTLKTGTRAVHFNYEPRPDVMDFFIGGGALRQTRRTSSIVMSMPVSDAGAAREVREYDFGYTQSGATGRSLMSSVTECAVDDAGKKVCLPASHFYWQDEKPQFQKQTAYALPALDSNLTPMQMIDATSITDAPYQVTGDFDGDGRRELLYYRPGVGAHLYFLNADGTLRKDVDVGKFFQSSTDARFHAYAADIDNDGAMDLPGDVDGKLAFASWTGTDMGKPVVTDIPYSQEVTLADMDGDGQVDVLQAEPVKPGSADHALYLYRNLGSRPGQLKFSPRQQIALLKNHKLSGTPEYDFFQVTPGLDGSRIPAIVISSGTQIEQIIWLRQSPNGALRVEPTTPAAIGLLDRPFWKRTLLADINGDGLTDMVYSDGPDAQHRTWRYQLNTGGHFRPEVDTHVADDRPPGVGETGTLVGNLDFSGGDEFVYPDKLVTPFCMGSKHNAKGNYTTEDYACSGELDSLPPWDDLGVYQYAVMKFVEAPDGSFIPKVDHDTGIVAQANLSSLGDLHGDGLMDVISPFSAWFANGRFKDAQGGYVPCPPDYGCGLHAASPQASSHPYYLNSFPDLMTVATDGLGKNSTWGYYPLSSPKPGLYTGKPVGGAARFIDPHRYYFDAPMYVVGSFGENNGVAKGFFSFDAQYRDAIYDSSGRGFIGFRVHVNTDVMNNIRQVYVYGRTPPLESVLATDWKEAVNSKGDDLEAGKPDPTHGYYEVDDWDCYGPATDQATGGLACKPQAGPLYQGDLRHKLVHDYDDKLKSMVDTDSTYEYDGYGNVKHSVAKAVTTANTVVTEITSTYVPPDDNTWDTERVLTRDTTVTTTPNGSDKTPATTTVKKEKFEYDSHGRPSKATVNDGKPELEVTSLGYQDDPASPNYGQLVTVGVSHVSAADGTVDDLRSVRIGYSADGYFATSYKSANQVQESTDYDPILGKPIKEVKGDTTTTLRYDLFGRIVMTEIEKSGRKPLTVNMRYLSCGKDCPPNVIYVRVDQWSDGSVRTVNYNVRNEAMNDPYK